MHNDQAIIIATKDRNLTLVKSLLNDGANINAKSEPKKEGITPLIVASENGYIEIV